LVVFLKKRYRRMSKRIATRVPGSGGSSVNVQSLMQQAMAFRRNGQVQESLRLYRHVLQVEPGHLEAKCGAARAVARMGNIREGVREARESVEQHPNDASSHATMAELLMMAGDMEGAIDHADRSIAINPRSASGIVTKAQCLEKMHRTEEALEVIDRAIEVTPGDPFPMSIKARFQVTLKDDTGARQTLESLTRSKTLYPSLASSVWNDLGKVYDRLGEYDAAYRAYTECGRITGSGSLANKCDRSVRLRMIDALKSGFTEDRMKRFSRHRLIENGPSPAFLVGFPRSGTTMTEQIMAAHPKVVTTDEKPFMNVVRGHWAKLVGGGADAGEMVDRTMEAHVRELRQIYWDQVESVFGTRCEDHLLVDKLPLNINNLGLINMVFPEAKIIVALRDPRDVCLSCFMQDFRLNNAMIHFLTLSGAVSFYERVMDLYLHYRGIMTLDSIEVRYEDTVTDLKTQAERLLNLLDLDWDDSVLRFYEKAREKYISTPSYTAVTEPVHTRAVKRWEHYATYFEEHQSTLARFVHEFGYD